MRVIHNPKQVSVIAGGVLITAGGIGLWQAGMLSSAPSTGRISAFTAVFAAVALIHGGNILFWDRRSTPSTLMRPQAADSILGILPAAVFGPTVVALPEIRDPARPAFWLLGLLLCSMAIAVVPEETKIGTARAEAVIENLYQAEGR